ncbi:MAG: DUF1294 domain-containing protein [Oscillospiraceae bacterium]|nr:DUF1294 domain-containing protein [Oscillospiraceae bacterium]
MNLLLVWLVLINLTAFVCMGVDKRRARHRKARIPERTLFLLATLGGTLGILLGVKCFRHKTQHNSFRYGMPGLLLAQMAVAMYVGMQNV